MESERAALKKAMEMKTIAARKHMEAVEEARREGLPIPEERVDAEVDPMIPEEPAGPGGAPLPDGEEEDETMNPADQAMNDEFAAELLEIKERKLLASRKTLLYHKEMSRWEKRKLSLRMHYGWMGKRDRDITVVLPWLLLGRREVSTNQSMLLQMGVTHILNMTHDCPCVYPNTFIYQRVPIRDNITTDLAAHFTTIINFIKRVEKCKGRVSVTISVEYVFSNVYTHRAPSADPGALHDRCVARTLGGDGLPRVCQGHPAGGRLQLPGGAAPANRAQPALPLRARQV